MVTIQEISFNRSMACIHLDNGVQYWIRRKDLALCGFSEGTVTSEQSFFHWIRVCQYPQALDYAVSMLARRPCSAGEIRSRLLYRKYTQEVVDLVMFKLEKEHLINDEEFCELWIRSRRDRGYGPAFIRRELKTKGLSDEIITRGLENLNLSELQNNAVNLARKAWKRMKAGEDIRKSRQKVIASLVRKGYSWEAARSACEEAENSPEE